MLVRLLRALHSVGSVPSSELESKSLHICGAVRVISESLQPQPGPGALPCVRNCGGLGAPTCVGRLLGTWRLACTCTLPNQWNVHWMTSHSMGRLPQAWDVAYVL